MKAITIRGIDSSVSSKLKQVAKNENKSLNETAKVMFYAITHEPPEP